MKEMLFAVCVMGCMVMSSALGALTYIDAEPGNTTINGAVPVDIAYEGGNCTITSARSDTDGLWAFRTGVSGTNGGGIWVTDGGAASGTYDRETTEALKIDVTLSEAGVYDLYAVVMNNNSGTGRWDVAVRIGDYGDFTNYNRDSEEMTQALASDFEGTVAVSGGSDMTMKVLIGQYTATAANETVSIYINGLDSWELANLDQRTRVDGIAYEMVPEPATLMLLSAGAFLGLCRRK